jgi:hypothetical protein
VVHASQEARNAMSDVGVEMLRREGRQRRMRDSWPMRPSQRGD